MARFCARCGKENLDDASFCTACGASISSEQRPRERRNREVDIRVPVGGSIAGIVFGIFLIFAGLSLYSGWVWNWVLVGAAFLLLLGVLIIIAAVYFRRRFM